MSSIDNDIEYLKENLLKYPDFPKPGFMFRDTFSLFKNPVAFEKIVNLFSNHITSLG